MNKNVVIKKGYQDFLNLLYRQKILDNDYTVLQSQDITEVEVKRLKKLHDEMKKRKYLGNSETAHVGEMIHAILNTRL